MWIDIRAVGFDLTAALRKHVEMRLKAALGPFTRRIQSVTARLEDVNANRGGIDKRCSIVAALFRRRVVVAQSVDSDLYLAIDEAAARMRSSIHRDIARQIARHRRNERF